MGLVVQDGLCGHPRPGAGPRIHAASPQVTTELVSGDTKMHARPEPFSGRYPSSETSVVANISAVRSAAVSEHEVRAWKNRSTEWRKAAVCQPQVSGPHSGPLKTWNSMRSRTSGASTVAS